MTDKEKIIKDLKDALDSLDYSSSMRLTLIRTIEYLQEEPVSEELEEAIGEYCSNPDNFISYVDTGFAYRSEQKDDIPLIIKAIKFGAKWHKEQTINKAYNFFEEYLTEEECKFGTSEWTEVKSNFDSIDSFIRAFKKYVEE